MYTFEIARKINNWFDKDNWKYTFDEEKGVFKTGIQIHGKLKRCMVYIAVEEESFQSYGTIDIGVDEDKIDDVAVFLTRVNFGLKYGNFELDYRDGEIRYQYAVDCHGGMMLTDEIIGRAVYVPALMFQKYGDGLLAVLFGISSPEETIAKIEE